MRYYNHIYLPFFSSLALPLHKPALFFTLCSPRAAWEAHCIQMLTLTPEMGEQKKGRMYHLTRKQTRSARHYAAAKWQIQLQKNTQLHAEMPPPQSLW